MHVMSQETAANVNKEACVHVLVSRDIVKDNDNGQEASGLTDEGLRDKGAQGSF